jgi:hypothetical protein
MSALSLCLSRACLGKMMIIFSSMKWHRKRQTRFFRFQLQDLTQLCVDLEHDIGGVLTVALEDVLIDAALRGQAQLLRAETEEKPCPFSFTQRFLTFVVPSLSWQILRLVLVSLREWHRKKEEDVCFPPPPPPLRTVSEIRLIVK